MAATDVRRLFWPILFAIGFFSVSPPNFDLWWHLQVGRDICRDHIWPSPDIYSYCSDRAWVIHSWLADCFYYLVWALGESICEGGGLLSLKGLRFLILLGFSLGIYLWVKHRSGNATVAILSVLCVGVFCWHRTIRPYLLSMLFFLYFYSFCTREEPRKRDMILMPATLLLWANIHGVFAIAAALLLLALAVQAAARLLHVRPYHSVRWNIISLVSIAAVFVNPEPIGLFTRVYFASSYPTYDWLSLPAWFLEAPLETLDLVVIFVILFIGWIFIHVRNPPGWPVLLSGRFVTDVACFLLPVLHIRFLWMLVFPLVGAAQSMRKCLPREENIRLIPVLLLFLFLFFRLPHSEKTSVYRLPEESVGYLSRAGLRGNVFCTWHWGGYLTWTSDKKAQVFVDTRIEPFTTREIDLSLHACEFPARYLGELVEYGTEFIIMPVGDRQPEWEMLAEKGLIEFLHKNEQNFLARVNVDKVREVYAETGFGAELPQDQTPFR